MSNETDKVKPENNTNIIENEDKSDKDKPKTQKNNGDFALNHMNKKDKDFFVDQNVDPDKQNVNIKGYRVGNPNPEDHPKEKYNEEELKNPTYADDNMNKE